MRSPPSIIYGASLTKELLSFHREPTTTHFCQFSAAELAQARQPEEILTSLILFLSGSAYLLIPFLRICRLRYPPASYRIMHYVFPASQPERVDNAAEVFTEDVAKIKAARPGSQPYLPRALSFLSIEVCQIRHAASEHLRRLSPHCEQKQWCLHTKKLMKPGRNLHLTDKYQSCSS